MAEDNTSNSNALDQIAAFFSGFAPLLTQVQNLISNPGALATEAAAALPFLRNMLGTDSSQGSIGSYLNGLVNGPNNRFNPIASPTIANIANLMAMNPMISNLTGTSDPRILTTVANSISVAGRGMFRNVGDQLRATLATLNINSLWKEFKQSNSPLTYGMRQAHTALASNYLVQAGAVSAEQVIRPEGLEDSARKTMTDAMKVVSVGKNILGMGDDVYKILSTASIIGGGTGKNLESAMNKFNDWILTAVKSGLSSQELQALVKNTTQQIYSLTSQGYGIESASAIARESSMRASAMGNRMKQAGIEYDVGREANKVAAQTVLINQTEEGIEYNAAMLALDEMVKQGSISADMAEKYQQRLSNGEMKIEDLQNVGNFARINEGFLDAAYNNPNAVANIVSKRHGDMANKHARNIIKRDVLKDARDQINQLEDPTQRKRLSAILDNIANGNTQNLSQQDIDDLSIFLGESPTNLLTAATNLTPPGKNDTLEQVFSEISPGATRNSAALNLNKLIKGVEIPTSREHGSLSDIMKTDSWNKLFASQFAKAGIKNPEEFLKKAAEYSPEGFALSVKGSTLAYKDGQYHIMNKEDNEAFKKKQEEAVKKETDGAIKGFLEKLLKWLDSVSSMLQEFLNKQNIQGNTGN